MRRTLPDATGVLGLTGSSALVSTRKQSVGDVATFSRMSPRVCEVGRRVHAVGKPSEKNRESSLQIAWRIARGNSNASVSPQTEIKSAFQNYPPAGPVAEQPHPVLATKALVTALGSAPGGAAPFGATRDRSILKRTFVIRRCAVSLRSPFPCCCAAAG